MNWRGAAPSRSYTGGISLRQTRDHRTIPSRIRHNPHPIQRQPIPETRDEVRKTTKRLVGLEVLEEDAKKIVLQCLMEPSLLNPERILRRLEMLSMPMQIDAVQAFVQSNTELANGVVERDEEVEIGRASCRERGESRGGGRGRNN